MSTELLDGPCQDCGRRYPPWHTSHADWNLVLGGATARDDPGGLLCPTCFLVRAEDTAIGGAVWAVGR